ncbi:sensor histidine kinase [Sulfurimonas sp.]
MIKLDNFFTSGHDFKDYNDLKNKFQMLNIALVLSSIALVYGIIGNYFRNLTGIIPIELFLFFINMGLIITLRVFRNSFEIITRIVTAQFSFFFLFLFYFHEPSELKHIWLFTYPIILLYFQNIKSSFYWSLFMLFMILISPFQTFVEAKYTLFQAFYLSFVLIVVTVIIYFYKLKMDEAKDIIVEQQNKLQNFNTELEVKVEQKTSELKDLNESLEIKVKEKVKELLTKDKLINIQSKQAVMGEMIHMIAHQWRQPLSAITLQISNLHFKRLLGEKVPQKESDKILAEISNTIVYLSDTIDDFQTYFRPNKEQIEIEVHELLQRAINFSSSRTKDMQVEVINNKTRDVFIKTYVNEMIQVILNLINNALDALVQAYKDDAKLVVYAKEIDDIVYIYVEDNANGISDEDLERIFEPYFSTKGKNGTGLGLYMSQMIVEKQFRGEISVESSANGTKFMVEIPKQVF